MKRSRTTLTQRIEDDQFGFIWNPLRDIKRVTIKEIDETIRYFTRKNGIVDMKKDIKAVVVLDRHIGDSLSLFSTHIKHLAAHPNLRLTIDASRCPLLRTASKEEIQGMLPKNISAYWSDVPLDYDRFDLVFDPYDVVDGIWTKKYKNDSAHVGIITGLEFLKARLKKRRRNILDTHMAALRRSGFVAPDAPIPEWVRYDLSGLKRSKERIKIKLVNNTKLISIFPFGLTPDRKYPPDRLREIIRSLCSDSSVKIILSGSYEDTPGIIDGIVGDQTLARLREEGRVSLRMNRIFGEVIGLMLSSDVIVSMDSGPLHIARMLRLNPIALYTSKVNDPERFKDFLWFVDDDTAVCLKPKKGDMHVKVKEVIREVKKRLI